MIFPKKIRGRRLFFIFLGSFLLASSLLPAAPSATPQVHFTQPEGLKTEAPEAWIQLAWESEGADEASTYYELHSSQSPDFSSSTLRYKGRDTASLVSGLNQGDWFFEVRLFDAEGTRLAQTAEPIQVTVHFIHFKIVLLLASLGLIVFGLTVLTILRGHRKHQPSNLS